ncbi:MAG: DUF4159 domain-containing protein [Planctomycetota bacterium]
MTDLLRTTAVVTAVCVWAGTARSQSFNTLFPPDEAGSRTVRKKSEADDLLREETAEEKLIDAFVMRHVKFNSDWNPDPSALPHFLYQFRKALRMRGQHIDEPLELSDPEIFRWPLLYITAHNSFAFTKLERENLKKYLQRGGRVFADDCALGAGGFFPSFISEIRSLFPGKELISVTADHERFGELYRILYTFGKDPGLHHLPPQVMLINDRIGVLLIHDDIGCAWEVRSPPTSAHPLGKPVHGPDQNRNKMFEWGFNICVYLMTH